jgi:hypothetical protein
VPAQEAIEEIRLIQAAAGQETVGQAQRHARIVGPLPGLQSKRPSADDVRDGRSRVAVFKLKGRPECIADGEANETAQAAVEYGFPRVVK